VTNVSFPMSTVRKSSLLLTMKLGGLLGWRLVLNCMLVLMAASLQGCIPSHATANWRMKANYLKTYAYVPPGRAPWQAVLNTCQTQVTGGEVCNGHGVCVGWFDKPAGNVTQNALKFCKCEPEWTDPECQTMRKSQFHAFMLSIFLGMFGADNFYLEYYRLGILKLLSLGGCGIWYWFDIVRIGSAPALTEHDFRVTDALTHFQYVLTLVAVAGFWGFFLSILSIHNERVKKCREIMLLKLEGASAEANKEFPELKQNAYAPYGTTYNSVP